MIIYSLGKGFFFFYVRKLVVCSDSFLKNKTSISFFILIYLSLNSDQPIRFSQSGNRYLISTWSIKKIIIRDTITESHFWRIEKKIEKYKVKKMALLLLILEIIHIFLMFYIWFIFRDVKSSSLFSFKWSRK